MQALFLLAYPMENLLRYEDMLHDPEQHMSKALQTLGVFRLDNLPEAIRRSSVDHLRKMEPAPIATHAQFARRGESGQWREYGAQGDLDYLESTMRDFGVFYHG